MARVLTAAWRAKQKTHTQHTHLLGDAPQQAEVAVGQAARARERDEDALQLRDVLALVQVGREHAGDDVVALEPARRLLW